MQDMGVAVNLQNQAKVIGPAPIRVVDLSQRELVKASLLLSDARDAEREPFYGVARLERN